MSGDTGLALDLRVGTSRYAVDVRDVVEIVPFVPVAPVPRSPDHVLGLLGWRGEALPVIDLGLLLHDRRCEALLSTRMVVVEYVARDGERQRLVLVAERVTDTLRRERTHPIPLRDDGAPALGEVLVDGEEKVRFLRVERLVSEELRATLLEERLPADDGEGGTS